MSVQKKAENRASREPDPAEAAALATREQEILLDSLTQAWFENRPDHVSRLMNTLAILRKPESPTSSKADAAEATSLMGKYRQEALLYSLIRSWSENLPELLSGLMSTLISPKFLTPLMERALREESDKEKEVKCEADRPAATTATAVKFNSNPSKGKAASDKISEFDKDLGKVLQELFSSLISLGEPGNLISGLRLLLPLFQEKMGREVHSALQALISHDNLLNYVNQLDQFLWESEEKIPVLADLFNRSADKVESSKNNSLKLLMGKVNRQVSAMPGSSFKTVSDPFAKFGVNLATNLHTLSQSELVTQFFLISLLESVSKYFKSVQK